MILERLPLARLKPAPYNPRKPLKPGTPAYERLARSLSEFDLVQPLVWNRTTGHIVGGHQRLAILKQRGITKVDCIVVELSLEREKALNIALNNAALASDWDQQRLIEVLDELQAAPNFDATLTGFDDRDLKDLLLAPCAAPVPMDPAEPPCVRITLEVAPDEWEFVRPSFDEWLTAHPDVDVHVRLPDESRA